MGVEPVSGSIVFGVVAVGALIGHIAESARENELRRRKEEIRVAREKEARRKRAERERKEREEKEREEREREEREERERKEERRRQKKWEEWNRKEKRRRQREEEARSEMRIWKSSILFGDDFQEQRTSQNYLLPYYREFDRPSRPSVFFGRCMCTSCNPPETSLDFNSCDCSRCQPLNFNPFEQKKNSVTVTFKPPQTTEAKSQNVNKQNSNTSTSSSNNQSTNTSRSSGNTSNQGKNSSQQASSSGSQQPQRNNNKKDTTRDYGKLNDFIKTLNTVLDRCNASPELRKKILAFFDDFEKHEENFLRILKDFKTQDIAIEDILSIVIKLFQSNSFARDVAYGNFIALMEIVAKYITEELSIEIAKDVTGNTKQWAEQLADCMNKVVQRKNIVNEIKELFEKVRKEIIADNTNRPLEPDFSGVFTKVYHYLKHRKVRGEEWTVKQYFDWIHKLLIQLKQLDPEYPELQDVNHSRREIVLEMYSTALVGRLFIVIRAYGRKLCICTFYVKEKKDKKAKDGDIYVDGKKKP